MCVPSPSSILPCAGVQWFGVDIGGTLTKGVYFECHDPEHVSDNSVETEVVHAMQQFVKSNLTYGTTGTRWVAAVCVCVCACVCVCVCSQCNRFMHTCLF